MCDCGKVYKIRSGGESPAPQTKPEQQNDDNNNNNSSSSNSHEVEAKDGAGGRRF
jgi:hypothetical protein